MNACWQTSLASSASPTMCRTVLNTGRWYRSIKVWNASTSPCRQRSTAILSSSSSSIKYNARREKLVASRDLKDLIESGEAEHIPDVMIHVDELERLSALRQPLLRRQQNAQAGAGDVIELPEVDDFAFVERHQHAARALDLRRVEAAGENQLLVCALANIEHTDGVRPLLLPFATPCSFFLRLVGKSKSKGLTPSSPFVERHPAVSIFVVVLHSIHHCLHEEEAQPARLPLLERLVHIHRRRLGLHIEGWGVEIGQAEGDVSAAEL